MKNYVRFIPINAVVRIDGNIHYVIDKDDTKEEALIQSQLGTEKCRITYDCFVEVVGPLTRGFEAVSGDAIRKNVKKYEMDDKHIATTEVLYPIRSTEKSAGYDFFCPKTVSILPGETKMIWTNIKAYMQDGEVLIADIRSSLGFDLDISLANTIGIIDQDYHNNPKNEGNIGIALKNRGTNEVVIRAMDKIAQVVFIPFLVADNCNSTNKRKGGFGSTGR
jgi:dUTP pyrophosphatase